ncbi:uncharacterized protein BDW47DRAFT_134921 [Aspergillus candidus]|uniref:Uncharacterized protein n=1 Tax=Aspergillus candidus TaxID=41067 RepID=A0A2I2EZA2_ASPCN|nr:hypothetical protein BDW47DRAFT_134921 [Aspergillus candidus]PLB33704.1 hypothetical protein BDW47DRAFT_134921 [Aspergillus candidus]
MSSWFPTEYDEDYQRETLWLRAGALCCSSLGLILLVTRHVHPFTLLFALPVVWSVADGRLLGQGRAAHTLVYVLLDFLCALFFVWNIPVTVLAGVVQWSFITIVMAMFFSAAVFLHGLIFLRATVRLLEESRLFGRGNGVQLPT